MENNRLAPSAELHLDDSAETSFLTTHIQGSQIQQKPISKHRGKNRSSRACTVCRERKVRCNIIAHGPPCSNCRCDDIECVLPLSRKQKFVPRFLDRAMVYGITIELRLYSRAAREKALQSMRISASGLELGDGRNNNSQLELVFSPKTIKLHLDTQPLALPSIFTPLPRHLDSTDLEYLHRCDAFILPNKSLQLALVKAYMDSVHDTMPFLDLQEFVSVVKYWHDGNRGSGREGDPDTVCSRQISFLLFQAVMFAGAKHVSIKSLEEAGYGNRSTAQAALFNRVQILFEYDINSSRHDMIQTLLLMSLCPPHLANIHPSTKHKDASHYLRLAISLSFTLGINRSSTLLGASSLEYSDFRVRKKCLERRMWWSAFVRDQTLALELNGSLPTPLIRRHDCDVEMLSLEDFEFGSDDKESEGTERIKAKQSALSFIEKAKLSLHSSDAMVLNLSTFTAQPDTTQPAIAQLHEFTPPKNSSFQSTILSGFESESEREGEFYFEQFSLPSIYNDCLTPSEQGSFTEVQEGINSYSTAYVNVYGLYNDYFEYLDDVIQIDNIVKKEKREAR